MESIVREIAENIDHTTALYEQILDTERAKQRAIVESHLDALPEIVAREEQLVAAAAALETHRLALRDRLAQADERLGAEPRLRQVIELLDGPERDALARKHRHLLDLAEQIHDVNRANFQLLRGSLDLLRSVIGDVFGARAEPRTYDPSGRQATGVQDAARVDQVM